MEATKSISQPANTSLFIGRQPIFDVDLKIHAYELLFRNSQVNAADIIDGTRATAQLINNALLEFGLEDLVGQSLAYINFTQEFLLGDMMQVLPQEQVVLEILEDVEVDAEVVNAVQALVTRGYKVALDDFVYDQKWDPLISLATVIKLDLQQVSIDEMPAYLELFKPYNVRLLAEKVETQEEFSSLKALGFDYFQGYFFCKPAIVSRPRLPNNHVNTLQLLSELHNPDIEFRDIEKFLSRDVTLTYKLLRYINSAHFSLVQKVTSIQQAISYMGLQTLTTWASLLVMTGSSDKPQELILTGLTRAKTCELLADEAKRPEPEAFFIVGLFSILDALMDHPMTKILSQLPMTESASQALLGHEGDLGSALSCSIACETGDLNEIHFAALSSGSISGIYLEAFTWSRQLMEELA